MLLKSCEPAQDSRAEAIPMKILIGLSLALTSTLLVTELRVGAQEVAIQVHPDRIVFSVGRDVVAVYRKGADLAKPYFWPLYGSGDIALTRAWPMEKAPSGGSTDHPHQKSAWFCHGDVIPEGISLPDRVKGVAGVDFWSESPGHGTIVCTTVGKACVAGHHGQVATQNEWRTAGGRKVLDEMRVLHLYAFGDTRLIVCASDLHARTALTFGDTKEGSFGVRVNDLIREQGGHGTIATAEGKTGEKACWGQRSPWCDYSGVINGRAMGIAIFDDPANRYPACWHVRGYGLMAANPFGRAKSGFPGAHDQASLVKLPRGEHLKLRYGVLLHPGDAHEGKVQQYFQTFVKLRGES
jgi:hypothetical protein